MKSNILSGVPEIIPEKFNKNYFDYTPEDFIECIQAAYFKPIFQKASIYEIKANVKRNFYYWLKHNNNDVLCFDTLELITSFDNIDFSFLFYNIGKIFTNNKGMLYSKLPDVNTPRDDILAKYKFILNNTKEINDIFVTKAKVVGVYKNKKYKNHKEMNCNRCTSKTVGYLLDKGLDNITH